MSYIATFMYQRVQLKPGKPQMRAGPSSPCMLETIVFWEKLWYHFVFVYPFWRQEWLGHFSNKWISGQVNCHLQLSEKFAAFRSSSSLNKPSVRCTWKAKRCMNILTQGILLFHLHTRWANISLVYYRSLAE